MSTWVRSLSPLLETTRKDIEEIARSCGLDFFDVIFEVVDYAQMNMLAAYGGFPQRYPHYTFGQEYYRLSKSYAYGLHRIYEMVINNDPCYAYLMESNQSVDDKLVMAHVYAHCDFFKNNMWFAHTNRKMMDEMANHASRIRYYVEQQGSDVVESFLDASRSIDSLIDIHSLHVVRREERRVTDDLLHVPEKEDDHVRRLTVPRGYLDSFVNPSVYIQEEKKRMERERNPEVAFPPVPEADVVQFLLENADLAPWQSDILSMLREEAYYFVPQAQTKIMNEGWATYWHSHIMTDRMVATSQEIIDYADHHSGTVQLGRSLNPYRLGVQLFQDIKERWDKGKFGPEYDRCEDMTQLSHWDTHAGRGLEKIFEIRSTYNDVGFIEAFFTPEFCERNNYFTYGYNEHYRQYKIESRNFEEVKRKLLMSISNCGRPRVVLKDANYLNRNEMYLVHLHEGVGLKLAYAIETLKYVYVLWKRPVHVETISGDKRVLVSFDGKESKVYTLK